MMRTVIYKMTLVFSLIIILLSNHKIHAQGTWELVYDEFYGSQWDIFFVDEWEGWTADFAFGNIYHTSNGGVSWLSQFTQYGDHYISIFFLNDSVGWVGNTDGEVYHTVNGGDSWIFQNTPQHFSINDLDFLDENYGYAAGGALFAPGTQYYFILHTENGGTDWEQQASGYNVCWSYGVAFANRDTGLVCNYTSTLPFLRTTNGGENWNPISLNDSTWFCSISYLSGGTFIAVGSRRIAQNQVIPVILKTDDYGLTWREAELDTILGEGLYDVSFTDSLRGIAVGDEGTSYITQDGGENWVYVNVAGDEPNLDISYPTIYTAYCLVGLDQIYRYVDAELTPPSAIEDLIITTSETSVLLAWSPINQDIFGDIISVEHYEIYRNEEPYFQIEPEFFIGMTADTVFIDTTVSINNYERLFYKVTAYR